MNLKTFSVISTHRRSIRRNYIFFFLLLLTLVGNSQKIYTIAGNGYVGDNGEGGPAINAHFYAQGLTIDKAGNIYLADTYNHKIKKISSNGIITTIAGTGATGYAGDGGPATSAVLSYPNAVTIDSTGNIYILDRTSSVVRKINTQGIITTIAGTGQSGLCSQDSLTVLSTKFFVPENIFVSKNQTLYIADSGNNKVRYISATNQMFPFAGKCGGGSFSDGGQAINAYLSEPRGLTEDEGGNIFIADYSRNNIRKVDTTGIITTLAGSVTQGFAGDGGPATMSKLKDPTAVVAFKKNVFIADAGNARIRMVDSSGIIQTVAGTGTIANGPPNLDPVTATSATLSGVQAMVADGVGNLYMLDGNASVRVMCSSNCPAIVIAAIKERDKLTNLKISPNPFVDRLAIENVPFEGATFTLSDALGRPVLVTKLAPGENEIVLPDLPCALYVYQVISKNAVATGKIIKN